MDLWNILCEGKYIIRSIKTELPFTRARDRTNNSLRKWNVNFKFRLIGAIDKLNKVMIFKSEVLGEYICSKVIPNMFGKWKCARIILGDSVYDL